MVRVFNSPLITMLFLVNGVAVLTLLLAYVVRLPEPDAKTISSLDDEISSRQRMVQQAELEIALNRPLFHNNRRRAQKAEPVAAPKQEKQRIEAPFSLVGIMGSNENNRIAYFQHSETQETLVARAGEAVGRWQVDSIGANFVTLTFEGERRVLQLAGGG